MASHFGDDGFNLIADHARLRLFAKIYRLWYRHDRHEVAGDQEGSAESHPQFPTVASFDIEINVNSKAYADHIA